MKLTNRARRQVVRTLFPGNYLVFKNLSLRVKDGGVEGNQLPFSLLKRILPDVASQLRGYAASKAEWTRFSEVTEDQIELIEPSKVTTEVNPTTWWCGNCNTFLNGPLGQVGIVQGKCPSCGQRTLVQLAWLYMCPTCHTIESVERPICKDCGDSRSVYLEGQGGRRREYRWRCRRHPEFELPVRKNCRRDNSKMVLKSTGGRLYNAAELLLVNVTPLSGREPRTVGDLKFTQSHASVISIEMGRIPIADFNSYYRDQEQSSVEAFINANTGNFVGFVSRLETDAITITAQHQRCKNEVTLHSLKHALLNAAPAVTGLTQDEFNGNYNLDNWNINLYDNVPGGTGGCRLLGDRRLNRWLQVARELAECHQIQCEDACRACLFLPSRLCHQGNYLLDRHRVLDAIPENLL